MPLRFWLIIPLTAALVAYQIFISFEWKYSLIRIGGVVPVQFAWGYGPSVLIVYIQVLFGYINPNEDKELIRQRRERGEMINRELGIVKRPAWWRRVRGDHLHSLRDKIMRNVNEVGGERGSGRRAEDDMERYARLEAQGAAVNDDGAIELDGMDDDLANNPRIDRAGARTISTTSTPTVSNPYTGKNERRHAERIMQTAAGVLFPNDAERQRQQRAAYLMEDGPAPPPYTDGERDRRESDAGHPVAAQRTNSTSTTHSIEGQPQQVRSMLDI